MQLAQAGIEPRQRRRTAGWHGNQQQILLPAACGQGAAESCSWGTVRLYSETSAQLQLGIPSRSSSCRAICSGAGELGWIRVQPGLAAREAVSLDRIAAASPGNLHDAMVAKANAMRAQLRKPCRTCW